jgi:hypothetical protein
VQFREKIIRELRRATTKSSSQVEQKSLIKIYVVHEGGEHDGAACYDFYSVA